MNIRYNLIFSDDGDWSAIRNTACWQECPFREALDYHGRGEEQIEECRRVYERELRVVCPFFRFSIEKEISDETESG